MIVSRVDSAIGTITLNHQAKRNALSEALVNQAGLLTFLNAAHTMSPQDFERIQGLRRVVYSSHDYSEGISAFKEKRKPEFRGQ